MSHSAHGSQPTPPTSSDAERLKVAVDVWKYIVSVQMHFNDIEMKVRNLWFTILAASLGLVGVVQGKRIVFPFGEMSISLSVVVLAAVIPISMLFYFMDRHWYHRLLQGAVAQCHLIEKKYETELPEIQLGLQISKASPVEFKGRVWKYLFFFVRDSRFRDKSDLHSDQKIKVLYKSVIYLALLIILTYGMMGGLQIRRCAPISFIFHLACTTSITFPAFD